MTRDQDSERPLTPFQRAAAAARKDGPGPEPVDIDKLVPLGKFVRLSSGDDPE